MCRVFGKFFFGKTDHRFTAFLMRIKALFGISMIIFAQLINWAFLLLDEIFYRKYHDIEIEKPVFILGPPRSGTTFLHRLMAKDERFSCIKLWEIMFAPSIIQKKFCLFLGRLDKRIGNKLSNVIIHLEKKDRLLSNPIHKMNFFEPEEDEWLLFSACATGHFFLLWFPFFKILHPLIYFDKELPKVERERIMTFYKHCVQRHLYVFGKDKLFLSKNPAFSTKIRSIHQAFPDAKIIFLARNPLDSVPSLLSLYSFTFNEFSPAFNHTEAMAFGVQQMLDYYTYPLHELEHWPINRKAIVVYNQLVHDPTKTVKNVYRQLELELTPEYAETLSKEDAKAKHFRSKHEYSLDQFGLTPQDIKNRFHEIFDRFGFEQKMGESADDFEG